MRAALVAERAPQHFLTSRKTCFAARRHREGLSPAFRVVCASVVGLGVCWLRAGVDHANREHHREPIFARSQRVASHYRSIVNLSCWG